MALLSSRGFDTPSLQAQGGQRRPSYFNKLRDIPNPAAPPTYSKHFGHVVPFNSNLPSIMLLSCRKARPNGLSGSISEAGALAV
jgi:hypothetical protein